MEKRHPTKSDPAFKHLTLAQRTKIEAYLNQDCSFAQIAKELGRSPSTIAREIKRNAEPYPTKKNDCVFLAECKKQHLCGDPDCTQLCSRTCYYKCTSKCEDYQPYVCEKILEPPYVCNGCRASSSCKLARRIYHASYAQEQYNSNLVDTRSGFQLSKDELREIDRIVSPLVKQGQAPFHILQAHPELDISEATLYRLIGSGLLEATDTDLKQKVGRKRKKRHRRGLHNETGSLISKAGHMYEDYQDYMATHDTFHVEMDCVEGKMTEKPALLTLHFPGLQMQLAFYLETHTSKAVVQALDHVEQSLGTELFQMAFPVILTDNGKEFMDIRGIERSCIDPTKKRTIVFFCEPHRSDEKGSCENNHKLIRDIIPKGTSLIPYNQRDITLVMNHINSYRRAKSFGKCAYDLAMDYFPEEFFTVLGLVKIPDDEVTLHPKLLTDRLKKRIAKYNVPPA